MYKHLTKLVLAGCGLGYECESVEYYNRFNFHSQHLIKYSSPTLNLDPWKNYLDTKHQEVSDKILQQEILGWKN